VVALAHGCCVNRSSRRSGDRIDKQVHGWKLIEWLPRSSRYTSLEKRELAGGFETGLRDGLVLRTAMWFRGRTARTSNAGAFCKRSTAFSSITGHYEIELRVGTNGQVRSDRERRISQGQARAASLIAQHERMHSRAAATTPCACESLFCSLTWCPLVDGQGRRRAVGHGTSGFFPG
jgi:hypothetical protein